MTSVGKQIRDARRAKGLTQDDLAKEMNVGRTVVSKWETANRLPDAETLLRLSRVLDYSFESESTLRASAPTPGSGTLPDVPPQTASSEAPMTEVLLPEEVSDMGPSEDDAESAPEKKPGEKQHLPVILGLSLICALLVCLLLMTTQSGNHAQRYSYTSSDGEVYTMERFQTPAENLSGSAYLRVIPTLEINRGEHADFWNFEFQFHEINGAALSIDRVEQVYFVRGKENLEQMLTPADLLSAGLDDTIAAHGSWSLTGGLPIQDSAVGVGILLRATDENGTPLSFSSYLPLSMQ